MDKPHQGPQPIYLDNAATTRPLPEVILTMGQVLYDTFANPSSTHTAGRDAKVVVETSRREIAALLGARGSQVFFTSGGTESDNTVLRGAVHKGIRRIVSCRAEHHAITRTLEVIEQENGADTPHPVRVEYVGLEEDGRLRMDELERILSCGEDTPTLVSLMHANNETGNLYDLCAIGELCHRYGALYHTDAVQTVGRVALDLGKLPVDFLSASAHKFHGPKGVGLLYIRQEGSLPAWILGGGQERGMRSGTENVAGIAGMCCALRIATERMQQDAAEVSRLRDRLVRGLETMPGVRFNGLCLQGGSEVLPGVVNITLPVKKDASIVLLSLDMAGVQVSAGSACMAGALEPSAVLGQLYGPQDPMTGCPSLRVSIGRFNTSQEIDAAVEAIRKVLS
ncbi:MAG TPA: cysteine desulfurase [Bacteroidetes bacterium]|nr:cysteine desulfurase [Bacteroidota bacterium]